MKMSDKDKIGKATLAPAIGEQLRHCWTKGLEYNGFDLKWWTDKSHFKHDISLQSVYYAKEGKYKDITTPYKEQVGMGKDHTLIFDSAGFQIASFQRMGKECNIKPIDSLRWQEESADIGVNLDWPPTLYGLPSSKQFDDSLSKSVDNFKFFEKNRQNYDMKLLNILHGENLPFINKWYNSVKDFDFDGWAIGMKPPFNPMLQAFAFMFLYDKGEFDNKDKCKWIHFFGTSGKNVVPTLNYLADKIKIPVSYDSSSYNIGSIYRTYYLPYDNGPSLSFGDKFRENPNIESLPCSCPVCKSITDISVLNGTDIYAGSLISLHNMYQYHQYNNTVQSLVKDKSKFINYLKSVNIKQDTLMSFDFIDYCLEHGFEAGYEKYKPYMMSNEIRTREQKTVFNF